ncbi:MAG TPA: prepilin peptidase [Alphaproteobacteria bacterium]|nr:prepilin peptidase [Alphaproteobacteria bacterium]
MLGFFSLDQFIVLSFLGLAGWAAYSDALYFRIPNAVSLGVLLLYPAHVLASAAPIDWPGALLIGAILFVAGIAVFSQGIAGGGDVKFLGAASLWAGTSYIFPFLIVMGMAGGALAAVVWLVRVGRHLKLASGVPIETTGSVPVPYGIAITAGAAYVAIHFLLAGN